MTPDEHVAQSAAQHEIVMLNGEPHEVRLPTLQQSIGLTDDEAAILTRIAGDCHSRAESMAETARPLIWESRMQTIDRGEVSPGVLRKLELLEIQPSQVILHHLLQLRQAMSGDRFPIVDAYVHGPESAQWTPLPPFVPIRPSR